MKDKDSKKIKKVIALIILILLLLLIPIICVTCRYSKGRFDGNSGKTPSSNAAPSSLNDNGSALPGGYTPKSRAEIMSELQSEQVTVTDRVSAQITFPNGGKGTKGSWVVENPATNKVVEQCEVVLNGKTVAESALIYPGQHIETITLSQRVNSGTYDVTATIEYYSLDTKTNLGRAGYRIKLTVS
jgi:hypothetical protein